MKVVSESRWDHNRVEELDSTNIAGSQDKFMTTKDMPVEAQSIHKQWGSFGGSSFAEDFREDSWTVSPAQSGRTIETSGFVKHEPGY